MLDPKFDTCFFERYAMVSLATLLGEHFIKGENGLVTKVMLTK